MSLLRIGDVNVVAHKGAARGGIIGTENADPVTLAVVHPRHQWNQMDFGIVGLTDRPSSARGAPPFLHGFSCNFLQHTSRSAGISQKIPNDLLLTAS